MPSWPAATRSTRPRRRRGAAWGSCRATRLGAEAAAAVFAAGKGAVVGPFKTATGHVLYQVEEVTRAELDAATAAAIRQELFRGWLAQQLGGGQVELKLEV